MRKIIVVTGSSGGLGASIAVAAAKAGRRVYATLRRRPRSSPCCWRWTWATRAPASRAARSGHIVNISPVGGLVGRSFNEANCASKFPLERYTESLASR